MAGKTTYGKLDQEDLYVCFSDTEGGEVEQKLGRSFSRIFNVEPGPFSGVIVASDGLEVIRVYRRPFSEAAVGHMCALVPPKGRVVVISVSTLYEKVADSAGRLLDNFKNPCETKIFTGNEEVIDFGDAYKVKVVVKIEFDLQKTHGDEI